MDFKDKSMLRSGINNNVFEESYNTKQKRIVSISLRNLNSNASYSHMKRTGDGSNQTLIITHNYLYDGKHNWT